MTPSMCWFHLFFVLMLFDVTLSLSLSLFFLHLTLGNFSLFFHYICVFCIWTSLLYMIAVIFTVFIDFVDFNTLNNHLYGVFFPIELYIHIKFYCCCCSCFHSLHIIFILIEQYHLNPLYCIDFNIHIYIFNWILLELLVCSMEKVVEKKRESYLDFQHFDQYPIYFRCYWKLSIVQCRLFIWKCTNLKLNHSNCFDL